MAKDAQHNAAYYGGRPDGAYGKSWTLLATHHENAKQYGDHNSDN
jgi:hypothetical protein